MADGADRVQYTRRRGGPVSDVSAWVQWAREAVTIVAAAGAAYMGIRVDLARNQLDIENIKTQQVKADREIEKLRDAAIAAGVRK